MFEYVLHDVLSVSQCAVKMVIKREHIVNEGIETEQREQGHRGWIS